MRLTVIVASLSAGLWLLACRPHADEMPSSEVRWELTGKAPTATGSGVVVTGHPLASRVGVGVLERGGNAVDAAVAVGFALAAVLPEAGNIGGGGFLVYRSADGSLRALDFREEAPAAAHRDMYLDENGEPTERSVVGHLAVGVPGSVAGLWEMHQELGSRPWAELVEPAIELARGHELDAVRAEHLAQARERLARFPASAEQFLPGGAPPPPGAVLEQPDLAATLERIRTGGREEFYRGRTAELLVAEMDRGGGVITAADLRAYEPVWREPIVARYRDRTVVSMPPPSSGGVTLALMLNVFEGFAADAATASGAPVLPPLGSAELIHLQAETMRWAFVDRNRYLGDPDFVDMPLERLLSREYASEVRGRIDPERATPTPAFLPTSSEGSNTTHYSIVDASGNAVAITTTLNSGYGSGVTVAGAGFLLNNEMDDFAAAPGRPNQFGLVEGEANAIAPGKRMLSSMTPTIVLGPDDAVDLVLGSPGGPTIITTVFQVLTAVVDHGVSLAEAVERPRVHHQALPDVLFFERGGLSADVRTRLEALGHELRERRGLSGDVAAIERHGDGWLGVADPRRGGGAASTQ